MIEFDINERSELTVKAEVLTVTAFNDIWRSDKAPNKLNAIKLLRYVYFMADTREKNPHRDVAFYVREEYAKADVYGDPKHKFSKKEQELVDEAIRWYFTLNKDCVDRMAIAVNRQVDQLTQLLESSEDVTMKNYVERLNFVKEIKNVLITKEQTDAYVEKAKKKAKTKGDKARSPIEMGLILNQSENESEIGEADPSQ
jgi:hypothetical protein